jgi:DNA replication protein DnaC
MLRPVPEPDRPDSGEARRPACPLAVCDGSGFVLREDNMAVPCDCRERMIGRAVSRGMGTGIPKRFRGVSFDRKPICDIDRSRLDLVRAFVARIEENLDAGKGIWFSGDLGTGKTSLAMLVSQAAERRGRSVAVYSVPTLLAEIKNTYDRDAGDSYLSLFRKLCSVDLLHLDDLGAERRTDWVLEQLYSIVNERWQDERSIVATTNLDRDELREQIGWRTVSRLVEICGDEIPIHGEDLRVTARD